MSRPSPRPVVVVGDLMVDVVARLFAPLAEGSDSPGVISYVGGGSAANTAAWLARVAESSVFVCTRIGRIERTNAERKRRARYSGLTRPSSASRTPSATYGMATRTVTAIRNFAARGSGFI